MSFSLLETLQKVDLDRRVIDLEQQVKEKNIQNSNHLGFSYLNNEGHLFNYTLEWVESELVYNFDVEIVSWDDEKN